MNNVNKLEAVINQSNTNKITYIVLLKHIRNNRKIKCLKIKSCCIDKTVERLRNRYTEIVRMHEYGSIDCFIYLKELLNKTGIIEIKDTNILFLHKKRYGIDDLKIDLSRFLKI